MTTLAFVALVLVFVGGLVAVVTNVLGRRRYIDYRDADG